MTAKFNRCNIHYLLATIAFAVYGIRVCPFLDSLSTPELLVPILVVFATQYLGRVYAMQKIRALSLSRQTKWQFLLDLSLFIAGGVSLAIYNKQLYDFPVESELKVLVGMSILGFFISSDLALNRQFKIAKKLQETAASIHPDMDPYPLTKKFVWFATISLVSVVTVVVEVINKDLDWLIHRDPSISLRVAKGYIFAEVIFVVAVMMSYVVLIILSYSRNLKISLAIQNQTLNRVASGDLAVKVAVVSNDEFGVMAQRTNVMIESMLEQNQEINITRDVCIHSLATLAETRDNETGGHILRTQNYVKVLAQALQKLPAYREQLDSETIELLYKSAPLHDIGKVGIPDSILQKPGKLTDAEFATMKQHPEIGYQALQKAQGQLGNNSFLRIAGEISLTHHEKWDGSGYPNGLVGEQTPLSGRLMAVADVYDALITKRVYKPAFSHQKAVSIISEGSGSHFDPAIVAAFLANEAQFANIAEQFKDQD